jgi:hypothetical protein
MRFTLCSVFAFCLFFNARLDGQELVSATLLGSKTKAQLLTQFNVPFIQFGVSYYRITYTTTDIQGAADTVSGLLVVPDNSAKIYPRLVYQHGTSGSKQDVPSFNYNGGEGSIGLLFGGLGYVALMPDYLGLGVSDGFHPYVHAASEASVALDMLRAAADYTAANNVQTNSQLFITGYSQGGHAAMALQREIEKNQGAEFSVTASAPLSGPYSIGEVMRALILTDEVYYFPAYIPNTILSYQTAYGNLFDEISDVFKPAYAGLIGQFYAGTLDLSDLNDQLIVTLIANEGESRPYRMFQDSIVQAVANDPAHPFNIALKDNNTYTNWTPQAPTRLYYCMADDQVPFENSILARDSLLAAGAADLQILDVNSTADHGGCVVPALTNTLLFFLGYQQIGTLSSVNPLDAGQLEFSPNPARDEVSIRELPARGQLSVIAFDGRILKSVALPAGTHTLSVQDIPDGIYMVEFRSGSKVWNEKLIVKH